VLTALFCVVSFPLVAGFRGFVSPGIQVVDIWELFPVPAMTCAVLFFAVSTALLGVGERS